MTTEPCDWCGAGGHAARLCPDCAERKAEALATIRPKGKARRRYSKPPPPAPVVRRRRVKWGRTAYFYRCQVCDRELVADGYLSCAEAALSHLKEHADAL